MCVCVCVCVCVLFPSEFHIIYFAPFILHSRHLSLPTSRTSAVLEIATSGNTGVSGQWLFRVDGDQVSLPGKHFPYLIRCGLFLTIF